MKQELGKYIGQVGIQSVFHVEIVVTENSSVNYFLYKNGEPVTHLFEADKQLLRQELQFIQDEILN